jgi:5-formyltetrahydrofolate cyclo-ligase
MTETMNNEKKLLRKTMRAALKEIDPADADRESASFTLQLLKTPEWRAAGSVLIFIGMAGEIDMAGVFCSSCRAKKNVYAPRVEGDDMTFYKMPCREGPWTLSSYGIREPSGDEEAFSPADAAKQGERVLVVTPGLAFDAENHRLGRGKGYYDRFFAALDGAGVNYRAIGAAFKCQIVNKVPVEAFDKRLDGVITG